MTRKDDPTFLHTRREAAVILAMWAICLAWTIGYSWLFGYGAEAGQAPLILGLPNWVFWAVAAPWAAAAVVSIVFAVSFMADDDLGEAPRESREQACEEGKAK